MRYPSKRLGSVVPQMWSTCGSHALSRPCPSNSSSRRYLHSNGRGRDCRSGDLRGGHGHRCSGTTAAP
ncbi:hypothetical protein G6F31_017819 [Rhizopus arrhizus]|nr:hypothetical protein G6F31_017819 [Rhizopus arrhizus]